MYDFIIPAMQSQLEAMRQAFQSFDATNLQDGDRFFEVYGPGNSTSQIDRPLERFHDYELMLIILSGDDRDKYKQMHKGTPFYFLGWLAFEIRNYEAANFYMAAALSEDKRKSSGQPFDVWIQNPAGQFMLLQQGNQASYVTTIMSAFVQNAINLFVSKHPKSSFRIEDFTANFSRKFIQDGAYSIVTALYGFIMEHEDRYKNLLLTSANIEATEPLLLSLFKGGLIFESLLKHYYPNNSGQSIRTLGGFSRNASFQADFPGCNLSQSCNSLQAIVDRATEFDYKTTFENTSKLRNTTGHKLLWDNVFNDVENYKKLYEQEILAILYVITKQWEPT